MAGDRVKGAIFVCSDQTSGIAIRALPLVLILELSSGPLAVTLPPRDAFADYCPADEVEPWGCHITAKLWVDIKPWMLPILMY